MQGSPASDLACLNPPHSWQVGFTTPLSTVGSYQVQPGQVLLYVLPNDQTVTRSYVRLLLHNFSSTYLSMNCSLVSLWVGYNAPYKPVGQLASGYQDMVRHGGGCHTLRLWGLGCRVQV